MFISRIRFRNFKSFRYADIPLSKGFVCLAGPNGSGKSNICDAIRFALGENSLKAIRAKKVSDLITTGADKAEIHLHLDGEADYEIKRAIRSDGKTAYRLNGKRTTRSLVLDALRPHGVEASAHNVIAQGEVERIVQMSPKERREIIDHVAGISDYEEKKKEALRELDAVEGKIGDATLILKEREGVLAELEKERDAALKYLEIKGRLQRLKGSLLYTELQKAERDHARAVEKGVALAAELDRMQGELAALDARIKEGEAKRDAIVSSINELGGTEKALREVEELKRAQALEENERKNRQAEAGRLRGRLREFMEEADTVEMKLGAFGSDVRAWSEELASLSKELAGLEAERARLEGEAGVGTRALEAARTEVELLGQALESAKDSLNSLELEKAKALQGKEAAARERARIQAELEEGGGKISGLKEKAREALDEAAKAGRELDNLFAKEKELNARLVELEKELLSVREKWAVARAAAGREPAADAIDFVRSLRDKRVVKGIHGTVGELCSFAPDIAVAVEAAAGLRLNYIIVDSVDAASEAVRLLKQKKAGRCTFIPLDRKFSAAKAEAREGARPLLELIQFDAKLLPAMHYVFGDTLLVKDLEHAREIGIGRARMVTLEGDVAEPSSVITGGFFKSRLALKERLQAGALEKEIERLKTEKDRLFAEITGIREEMNRKRKARADAEVRAKSLEIEVRSWEAADERRKKLAAAAGELSAKESELEEKTRELSVRAEEKAREVEEIEEKRARAKASLASLERAASGKALLELGERVSQLKEKYAALEARLGGRKNEIELLSQRKAALENDIRAAKEELHACEARIKECEASLEQRKGLITQKELALAAASDSLQGLFRQREELQRELEELARSRGAMTTRLERLREDRAQSETSKAVLEQKLADLKAEFSAFGAFEPIEGKKDELQAQVVALERELEALGAINLRAPEVYEERKKDLEELRVKVEKLAEEKSAVLLMIDELEAKKLAIFQETFRVVAENFRKLFGYIFKGEGTLALQVPTDPFNSGLMIKARYEGGRERHIEALSGGERSLLALLFVFAIHMYKPAPFYILDEVEAALDKANSKKLADLLRELAKNTQFIVVTHNDTILSSADVALGVTMTEEGSKIVGVNLTEARA
ncbi:MAG: chromosome segregation protein SMC [Candidatus Micrarchaeia archaeon]